MPGAPRGLVTQGLERFWFVEAPAERLAGVRILVGSYAVLLLARAPDGLREVGATDPSLFVPVGVAKLLSGPVPPTAWAALLAFTLIAGLPFVAGWRYRVSGPLFAGLLLAVLSYRNSWSMVYHVDTLMVLHVIVLGVTPSADAWSLDAWSRSRRLPQRDARPREYGWALRLLCAITVSTYLLAGLAKVFGPQGWGWAAGESLRAQIAMDALRKELLGEPTSAWTAALKDEAALFTAMGVGTLAVELGAPIALFGRRLAALWLVAAYLLHWGVLFMMRVEFPYHLWGIAFVSFLPIERIVRRMRCALAAGAR